MCAYYRYSTGLPRGVKTLLIANAAVFVVTLFLPHIPWNVYFGLIPALVTYKFMVWQFFTYMFLHGGFSHILFNMFALWMFGVELEYNWGTRDFIKFYLTCGVGGGILVWLTAFMGLSSWTSPTIGASGAIFGILVAYGMMWPDRLIFIFGILPMKALHFVIIFGAIDLFQGLSRTAGNIAVFAHVGGGVTGFIYLKYGWRIFIHLENAVNRFKARKFTVTEGGKSSSPPQSNRDGTYADMDDEVDRILDKIAREGMDSLDDREKRILERASKKRRG